MTTAIRHHPHRDDEAALAAACGWPATRLGGTATARTADGGDGSDLDAHSHAHLVWP